MREQGKENNLVYNLLNFLGEFYSYPFKGSFLYIRVSLDLKEIKVLIKDGGV